jgi:hypothetical protein
MLWNEKETQFAYRFNSYAGMRIKLKELEHHQREKSKIWWTSWIMSKLNCQFKMSSTFNIFFFTPNSLFSIYLTKLMIKIFDCNAVDVVVLYLSFLLYIYVMLLYSIQFFISLNNFHFIDIHWRNINIS